MPFRMGDGQAIGKLPRNRPGPANRQGPVRDLIAQRAALDQLHGNPRRAVALADVVDGHDGRVIERGGGARFGFESPAAGLVADERLGK